MALVLWLASHFRPRLPPPPSLGPWRWTADVSALQRDRVLSIQKVAKNSLKHSNQAGAIML